MYRLNKYLLYYNVFISLCSVALVLYFSIVTNINVSPIIYCFTFFGTLGIYNLFRLYPSINDYFKHRSSFSFDLIFYSLIICAVCYWFIPNDIKLFYIIPAVLSLAYKFPLIDKKDLRSLPYLKVFIIAAVWILAGAIPVLQNTLPDYGLNKKLVMIMVSQFFFFIAITIPFDVFDVEKDKMKTLATTMGTKRAIIVAKICLIIHVAIAILKEPSSMEIIGHVVIATLTFIVLSSYKHLQQRQLQYYCVDGLIILQTLIIYFLHWSHELLC